MEIQSPQAQWFALPLTPTKSPPNPPEELASPGTLLSHPSSSPNWNPLFSLALIILTGLASLPTTERDLFFCPSYKEGEKKMGLAIPGFSSVAGKAGCSTDVPIFIVTQTTMWT